MKKLKVFLVNLDGRKNGLVATYTKKEAALLLGVSLNQLNTYGSETGNAFQVKLASENPGVVFINKCSSFDESGWEKLAK